MTGTLAAQQFIGLDANGAPLVGGLVYTYLAGTTTAATTYSDAGLTTPNTNPVQLDAAGVANIFLDGSTYKFVTKTSAGATVRTLDNITSIPATANTGDLTATAGENLTAGQIAYVSVVNDATCGKWYKADADATASSTAAQGLGVVIADAVTGASVTIRVSGVYAAASGLTPGSAYYISATAGALTASAPTNARLFCRALSATSYLISFRQEEGTVTGGGTLVRHIGPVLVTPVLGAASGTSLALSSDIPISLTNGQTLRIRNSAQTVSNPDIYIPDLAGSTTESFVTLNTVQTLTNKTLTGPSLTVGSGSATATLVGVLNTQYTSTGCVIGTALDLMTYTVPANTLSANGKGLRLTAWGVTGANANLKVIYVKFPNIVAYNASGNTEYWKVILDIIRMTSTTYTASYSISAGSTIVGAYSNTGTACDWTATTSVGIQATVLANNDVLQYGMIVEAL